MEKALSDSVKPNERLSIYFHGEGAEYFGIWFGNLALTILTLGLYSPWAKVRRMKYFYRSTEIADSTFDYDAEPKRILLGRFIAIVVFLIYSVFGSADLVGATAAALATIIVIPIAAWFYQQAMRFRARYSSWRGIRFRFLGSYGGAFLAFVILPIVAMVTLGLLFPLSMLRLMEYQVNNTQLGGTRFQYDGALRGFVDASLRTAVFALVSAICIGAAVYTLVTFGPSISQQIMSLAKSDEVLVSNGLLGLMIVSGFIILVTFWATVRGFFQVEMHRLLFNHLSIGPYRFRSELTYEEGVWIVTSNSILKLLTLGFFKPFAAVRVAKMKLENVTVYGPSNVSSFVAVAQENVPAIGEEAAELLDLDFGI